MHAFFTKDSSDSEFSKFTVITLKVFLMTRSVSGKKQELVVRALYFVGCNYFFSCTCNLLVSQETMYTHFFPILHHLTPVIFANTTVAAFVLFGILNSTSIVILSLKLLTKLHLWLIQYKYVMNQPSNNSMWNVYSSVTVCCIFFSYNCFTIPHKWPVYRESQGRKLTVYSELIGYYFCAAQ